ncbi:MAG: hypothetical protein HC789_07790 [Microcoleus sp. CSU_2_2]|nr:hypothetical protein [Microcoleus sp. SU_5_3]NJS10283.1 hypothetical protein [Microcoleus sp. CSU_2_2]
MRKIQAIEPRTIGRLVDRTSSTFCLEKKSGERMVSICLMLWRLDFSKVQFL